MSKKAKDVEGRDEAGDTRIAGSIRRTRSWGGLAAFGLTAGGGYLHGGAFADVAFHALVAGVVGLLVAWSAAVTVWRHLRQARVRVTVEAALAARRGEQP